MGSSAYFEVYSVGNVQIWRFSKSFNSLREPSISINSIGIILIYYFSWSWNLEHTLEHPLQSKKKKNKGQSTYAGVSLAAGPDMEKLPRLTN